MTSYLLISICLYFFKTSKC